jgi:hypothetical protein
MVAVFVVTLLACFVFDVQMNWHDLLACVNVFRGFHKMGHLREGCVCVCVCVWGGVIQPICQIVTKLTCVEGIKSEIWSFDTHRHIKSTSKTPLLTCFCRAEPSWPRVTVLANWCLSDYVTVWLYCMTGWLCDWVTVRLGDCVIEWLWLTTVWGWGWLDDWVTGWRDWLGDWMDTLLIEHHDRSQEAYLACKSLLQRGCASERVV